MTMITQQVGPLTFQSQFTLNEFAHSAQDNHEDYA